MNIGIDIDGVLCSEDLFRLVYGTKYCCENELNFSKFLPFSPETQDTFGWSSKEDMLFWQKYYLQYLTTSDFIYPDCSEIIQSLYESGHKIFIISQRNQATLNQLQINENMMQLTHNWLCKNKIPFHKVILANLPKEKYIRENSISLMIDDNPQLLMALSKHMMVIGFRAHCNLETLFTNIPIVSSWKELECRFKKLNI